jgi:O-antigen/teichoic acid export membrane protein
VWFYVSYRYLNIKSYISTVSGLQFFQLWRFGIVFLIGIFFTKSHLNTVEIGAYETILLIAGAVSFFWLQGLIQSFLPLFSNNKTFVGRSSSKSPELFNFFLLITVFSVLTALVVLLFSGTLSSLITEKQETTNFDLLLVYILISNPAFLVEFFYLVLDKPYRIIWYGIISYGLQLMLVAGPVFFGYDIRMAVWGLIAISGLRILWLGILLFRYAEFRFSFAFMREHLVLGFPLILTALLSGSALYINGLVISAKLDGSMFAIFRYGARELPLAMLLANAFDNAMVPRIAAGKLIGEALAEIKHKSARLMYFLYPVTIVLLLTSKWLFPVIFNPQFAGSAQVFNVFLLIIISRMVFPQTLLVGLKKTRIILFAALAEMVLCLGLSIWFIQFWGIIGVAWATVIAYIFEKLILILYAQFQLKIRLTSYTPVLLHGLGTLLVLMAYVAVEIMWP